MGKVRKPIDITFTPQTHLILTDSIILTGQTRLSDHPKVIRDRMKKKFVEHTGVGRGHLVQYNFLQK